MSGVPEFCVKDMASWFRFVVLTRPALLQGLQVSVCVMFMSIDVCMVRLTGYVPLASFRCVLRGLSQLDTPTSGY